MSSSKEQWNKAHASTNNNDSTIPSSLYTDENPATTIKGTGFKNERIAKRTIELTSQPGVRYKQYWTIRAMRERAAHHPNKSVGIRDAITVFDEWLENHKEPSDQDKHLYKQEWEEFRRLCQSDANKHCYGKDPTKEELRRARDDLANGQKLLIQLLSSQRQSQSSSRSTPFPLPSFVALFGGPGMHGYGSHEIDSDQGISRVHIDGDEGIQELIGAAKTSKLMLGNVAKVEVTYNRSDELAKAAIIRSKQSNTLENLWGRSVDTYQGSKKRQRIDCKPKEEEDTNPEWTCNTCTFVHAGSSKRDFLACELCGSTRLTDT